MIQPNKKAPAYSMERVSINSPVQEVWDTLVSIADWPSWNANVKKVHIAGDIEPGSEFLWRAGGMKIRSRIEHIEAPNKIAWTGRTMGIRAIHSYELSGDGNHTEVCTEESFEGLAVQIFSGYMQKTLEKSLEKDLDALKRESEKRHQLKH